MGKTRRARAMSRRPEPSERRSFEAAGLRHFRSECHKSQKAYTRKAKHKKSRFDHIDHSGISLFRPLATVSTLA